MGFIVLYIYFFVLCSLYFIFSEWFFLYISVVVRLFVCSLFHETFFLFRTQTQRTIYNIVQYKGKATERKEEKSIIASTVDLQNKIKKNVLKKLIQEGNFSILALTFKSIWFPEKKKSTRFNMQINNRFALYY